MLRINPTEQINFVGTTISNQKDKVFPEPESNKSMALAGTLAGLAALGLAAAGLKKTSKTSYEEALKKAGVQIKDGIATLLESGEKFTGKIERFEKRNRKETVEFVDGVMTEKLYYTAFGKEIEGYFYKGDACYNSSRYKDFLSIGGKPSGLKIDGVHVKGPFFAKTRKYVASSDFDKLVQEIKEGMAKASEK